MPRISRHAAVAALAAAALGAGAPAATASPSGPPCTGSVPFVSGDHGYHTFRIPALVRSGGALLAFAEGRRDSPSDTGTIEVVLRRSTDRGCTWGPLTVVSRNGDATAGNPSPVALPGGEIVLLTTRNGHVTEREIMAGEASAEDTRRVFVQRSADRGRSWTPVREITSVAKRPDWRWYATGPGHAIVLRHGRHAGRIVVPANHSSAPAPGSPDVGTEQKYYGGHDLISDDGGRSWRIGFSDDPLDGRIAPNETTVAELPDGRLYFNSRDHGDSPGHRVDAYSTDGGETLTAPYRPQPGLAGPRVQGSVLQAGRGPLLFSGPADPDARKRLTIRSSRDGGRSWRPAYEVDSGPAAYSDLVRLGRGEIGVLYETGEAGPYETITFHRIPRHRIE